KIKLLTFDAVNTLIKVSPCPFKQYYEAAKQNGYPVAIEKISEAYGPTWKTLKLKYPNYGLNQGIKSRQWWEMFIKNVFDEAGYTVPDDLMCKIVNQLYHNFGTNQSWKVINDVKKMLNDLKNAGFKLAVVSNFDERLPSVFKALNLYQYFDLLVNSRIAKSEKPDTKIFLYTLELANVRPEETVHIGDDYCEDFIPAQQIGIQPYL
ncbi:hypothetical protein HELRODRAFT_143846, partial [Helobdella robusta]|uniref:Haloacid dehalogenase-like hydrolase domain-containing protein 3 n=1 Tax=Helobdella robusta TaxID=6412 RepID=T1EJC6_HELRO